LKSQPDLAFMIVVVLSSSNNEMDIHEAYTLGARSYLVKPLSIEERLALAKAIKAYWLDLNMCPKPALPRAISEAGTGAATC
jgi:CheY-like chemotaxis protein